MVDIIGIGIPPGRAETALSVLLPASEVFESESDDWLASSIIIEIDSLGRDDTERASLSSTASNVDNRRRGQRRRDVPCR